MEPIVTKVKSIYHQRERDITYRSAWQRLHIDPILLLLLLLLASYGLFVLTSASGQDLKTVALQGRSFLLALGIMFVFAQIPIKTYRQWTPWVYLLGVLLLVAVLLVGEVSKGAQRWLHLGVVRFQPSEILKLAMPMLIARYLGNVELPPKLKHIAIAGVLIVIPGALIAKQPDLGTGLMVMISGGCVILASGILWRYIFSVLGLVAAIAPFFWAHMHDYQRQRLLTFMDPEKDPLGTGYHIIQSKIAIGSGGIFGKGWMLGSQSHLNYLPEDTTDFIFAVAGEELGLVGGVVLVTLFFLTTARCLYIASQAQDNFSRLLASGLSMTFFFSVFVNMGMVMGILPVVGVPLPLISYGGTSLITMMGAFGVLMSIHTQRKLISS